MSDVSVRIELGYNVPPTCESASAVLALLRTPAWVRLVMRFAAPRIKEVSPADGAVLARLERDWCVPLSELARGGAISCVICMSTHAAEDERAARLPCGHTYHQRCVRAWLQQRSSCPICRAPLPKALTGKYAVRCVHSALVLDETLARLFDPVTVTRARAADPLASVREQRRRVRVVVSVRLRPALADACAGAACDVRSWLANKDGGALEREHIEAWRPASPTSVAVDLLCRRVQGLAQYESAAAALEAAVEGDNENESGEYKYTYGDARARMAPFDAARKRHAPRLSVLEPPMAVAAQCGGAPLFPGAKRLRVGSAW